MPRLLRQDRVWIPPGHSLRASGTCELRRCAVEVVSGHRTTVDPGVEEQLAVRTSD